ncbi:hypothetical protein SR1949_01990 [Sphaerospermopsis reniformis]|uniref:Uncharacterized protein n=1 Tax=Sphaerospermopsis reniformis TaxID=531300 RepID=A0A479ZRJ2_9CYAN|nr:hypothetical protein SR1949_01990 [Sphaerospermopsis reniformis]
MRRVAIAQNTLEILDVGSYIYPNGNQVDIARELQL